MRLDFGQISEIFFFSNSYAPNFQKHRRYFPIPLGIRETRESFREIAARRKRVKYKNKMKTSK